MFPGQPLGIRLGEGFAAGGEVNGVRARLILAADVCPALVQRVSLEQCPAAPAVRVVVHLLLLIQGVVPDLVGVDAQNVPFLGPAQDGLGQHVPHRVGKQRHNVDMVHDHIPSIKRTLIYPASMLVSRMNSDTAGIMILRSPATTYTCCREGERTSFNVPSFCPS